MAIADSHRFLFKLTHVMSSKGNIMLPVSPLARLFHNSRLIAAKTIKSRRFFGGIMNVMKASPISTKIK